MLLHVSVSTYDYHQAFVHYIKHKCVCVYMLNAALNPRKRTHFYAVRDNSPKKLPL